MVFRRPATAKQQTTRDFLAEMEEVPAGQALIDLIEPHYPKASKKAGWPPCPLAAMLRTQQLQQRYSPRDPAMGEALIRGPRCAALPASGGSATGLATGSPWDPNPHLPPPAGVAALGPTGPALQPGLVSFNAPNPLEPHSGKRCLGCVQKVPCEQVEGTMGGIVFGFGDHLFWGLPPWERP